VLIYLVDLCDYKLLSVLITTYVTYRKEINSRVNLLPLTIAARQPNNSFLQLIVPVGDTETIPFTMRKESKNFDGASCETKMGAGGGSRWWYINSAAALLPCREVGNKPIVCLSSNCKFKFLYMIRK
jgi:hypothetical protein